MTKGFSSFLSFLNAFVLNASRTIILYVFILLVFLDRNLTYFVSNPQYLYNWIVVLGILPLLFWLRKKRFNFEYIITNLNLWLWISTFIFLLLQIVYAYSVYFYTGWDAKTVRDAAFTMVEHMDQLSNFSPYFSYHTNQVFITIISGFFLKIGFNTGLSNYYLFLVFLSGLLVNLSILFTSKTIYLVTQRKDVSYISYILFMFLFGFSPWITIPYSDTFSILFTILVMYFYLRFGAKGLFDFKWIAIAILTYFGAAIKPQVWIVFFAILGNEIFKILSSNIRIYKFMLNIFLIILTFFSSTILYKNFTDRYDFKLWEGRSFTYTHYLMTGLNSERYGVYLDRDADLSYQFGTIAEREAANWEVIFERLNDFGFLGFMDFMNHKMLINFNDGTFALNGEGGFIVETFSDKTIFSSFLKSLVYPEGSLYPIYIIFTQILWLLTIILIIFGFFKGKVDKVFSIYFIGTFLFTLFFEARARYLISYLPIYFVIASYGINYLLTQDN